MKVRPNVRLSIQKMNKSPLIMVTRRSTFPQGRSIGFVLDTLEKNRIVVATVRHAFQPEDNPKEYIFHFANGYQLPVLSWHTDSQNRHDLAFVILDAPEGYRPIRFEQAKEGRKPPKLFNARNHAGGSPAVILTEQHGETAFWNNVVMARPFHAMQADKDYTGVEVLPPDNPAIASLEEQGHSRLSYMNLYSRPGYSGSPIWDEQWNLYGMGVRGKNGANHPEGGDEPLAYYPANFLFEIWRSIKENIK